MNFDAEVSQMMIDLHAPEPRRSGTLVRSVGMRLETRGLMAPLGASCEVLDSSGHRVEAEVVGFNDDTLYLMPFTEPNGIGPGARVTVLSNSANVNLGTDLLGRIIDGRGQPLDGKPAPDCPDVLSLLGRPLNPMERGPINQILDVGIKAINGVLTIGRGQRLGLVAGSGVGKSVLLGMMTRFTEADINRKLTVIWIWSNCKRWFFWLIETCTSNNHSYSIRRIHTIYCHGNHIGSRDCWVYINSCCICIYYGTIQ